MTALLLAATTAAPNTSGWITVGVLAWLAGYAVLCAIYPFTAHGRCNGTGKLRSPSGKAWRTCRGCKGSGRKLRIGRRLFDATTRHRRNL